MARYLARRLLLAIVTLWLLVTIVFGISNVLPRDVGRTKGNGHELEGRLAGECLAVFVLKDELDLRRLRQETDVGDPDRLALEGDRVVPPGGPEEPEGLVQPPAPVVEAVAEGLVLPLAPPDPGAHHQPAPAHGVE